MRGGGFDDIAAHKGKTEIGEGINIAIRRLAEANELTGVIDQADFNDRSMLGSGKEMQDKLSKLVSIFEDLDFSANRAGDDDILGDAYEYFMMKFAVESGKSKGQFYTPAEVSRIMAKVIGIGADTEVGDTIYDPTCGSGSLLIRAADEAPNRITIYGQEMDNATWALARMNMFLHDEETAEIQHGNTLAAPAFTDDGRLKRFDFAVANPPFSSKEWTAGVNPSKNQYMRFEFGAPPPRNGDYAFLLHLITSLRSAGKGAIILPHGVLFRGNKEAAIRRNLVRRGFIKGIIGLPANLFYGTGIPACIVVIDKENAGVHSGIFMIDASKGFVKDGNKNRLRERDIHKIVDTFNNRVELPGYSRMVSRREIANSANDYNLNIPRYIDSVEPEDLHDLDAHINGGIPDGDIDALAGYWTVFPALRGELFQSNGRPGYSDSRIPAERVKAAILEHAEFAAFQARGAAFFQAWRDAHDSRLRSVHEGAKPQELIRELSEDILKRFDELPLIDAYDIYQHLMDYWNDVMQEDAYLVASDGWAAGRALRPPDDKETPDFTIKEGKTARKYVSDLIPPALIIARFFADERRELDALEADAERLARHRRHRRPVELRPVVAAGAGIAQLLRRNGHRRAAAHAIQGQARRTLVSAAVVSSVGGIVMSAGYAELHCKSFYSFRQGASHVHEFLAQASEYDYSVLALADTNMCGALEFARQANGVGIKPISGCELTLTDGSRLTLLAWTRAGYGNISSLVTLANRHDRREPRLDPSYLPTHADGIALLGSLDDPTEDEWYDALEPVLDTELSDHVWMAINRSPAWFDVLDSIGVIRQWLSGSDEELLYRTIWFLRSIQEKRPDRVAELVSPFLDVSEDWNQRLLSLLVYSKIGASRNFFDFALEAIEAGLYDRFLRPNGDELGIGTWYRAKQLAESKPAMACELVASFCGRSVKLMQDGGDSTGFLLTRNDVGGEVMETLAASAPKQFVESLLPSLKDFLDISTDKTKATPWRAPIWASGFGASRVRKELGGGFISAMASSLRWMAINEPTDFRAYAQEFKISKYATIHNLLMRAYEADGKLYTDEAVQFLLEDLPARVSASRIRATSDNVIELLIKSVTPHCSAKNLVELEEAILQFYPDYEKNSEDRRWRGSSQMRLLECVDTSRISDTARRRLQELHRKFGEYSRQTSDDITGGRVRSPIPKSAIPKMSDDNWLQAMARYSLDGRSYAHDNWLKGGPLQLSSELEAQVKEDPARFARLIHRMPDEANRNYFEAILRGIAASDDALDMELVASACLRCDKISGHPLGRWITQPLTRFPDSILPDRALELIAWYATEDTDPDPTSVSSTRSYTVGGQQQLHYDPLNVGINTVRGTAADTVANLIFQDERYLSFFKPYLRTMAKDHSDAVRACVAEALLGTLRYDRDLAVALFLDLCDADERLLGTHYFERFLYYAKRTHFKELKPILTRMVNSEYEEVSTAGARQACLASLGVEDAIPLARQCLSGSVAMKKGAAEIYAANIRNSALRAECEKALISLFSDEDAKVREIAARCFLGFEGRELQDYKELARAFIQSPAFEADFNPLIRALSDTTANMPNEILLACERYFDLAGTSAGDASARMSADSRTVISLILRVYGKAANDGVISRCLDLIDKAKLLGADGVDGVEAAFDR